MGAAYSMYISSPDTCPRGEEEPSFDPLYGFPEGRKERKMLVTEEEMVTAGVAKDLRDYCAHHLIDFYKCKRENFPWVHACKGIKHDWEHCQVDDQILRMKEYERERRLRVRSKRISAKQNELLE